MRVFSDGEWICHNTWPPQHGLQLAVKVVGNNGEVLLDIIEDDLMWPDESRELYAFDVFELIGIGQRKQCLISPTQNQRRTQNLNSHNILTRCILERYTRWSNVPALVVLCVGLAVQDRRVLIACVVMVASPTSGVDRNIIVETSSPSANDWS